MDAFKLHSILGDLNEIFVCLIPKSETPEFVKDSRPISLCNTSYKVLSKLLVNRLRSLMDKIISPMQASFIPGRRFFDNTLIIQEIFTNSITLKVEMAFV